MIGAVQQGNDVKVRVIDRADGRTLTRSIREVYSHQMCLLATDDFQAYPAKMRFPRGMVNHAKHEYVVGAIHANTYRGLPKPDQGRNHRHLPQSGAEVSPALRGEFEFRINNCLKQKIFDAAVGTV